MQVLMRSDVPAFALLSKKGSARKGRAIETRSASPLDRISSAISGVLMRFVATRGIVTPLASWRSFLVTQLMREAISRNQHAITPLASWRSFLVTQLRRDAISRNQHAITPLASWRSFLVTQLRRDAISRNQHALSRSYRLPRHPSETATWHAGSSGFIRVHQGSIRLDEGSSPEAATWYAESSEVIRDQSGLMRGHHLKPPRGTHVAIVGTRASCHPMPVLMMSAPDEGCNQHAISRLRLLPPDARVDDART
jgi:hypothetical protein